MSRVLALSFILVLLIACTGQPVSTTSTAQIIETAEPTNAAITPSVATSANATPSPTQMLQPTPTPNPAPTAQPTPRPEPTPGPTPIPIQEDIVAPELVEVTVDPSGVDVGVGVAEIRVAVRATDDLTGIRRVELAFESPTGGQLEETSATLPMTSTPNDAVYRVTLVLPRYSETGTWWLSYASLEDGGGNIREYDPEGLEQLGVAASFEVVASDVTGPELVEVTFDQSGVDVGVGDANITVKARVTDDLSRVSKVALAFESPSGGHVQEILAAVPTTGTQNNGEYVATLTLARYSETGTWQLRNAELEDEEANTREYQREELEQLGVSASFEVWASDVVEPELVEMTVDPSGVDVGVGVAEIRVAVRATDDLTGIRRVELAFKSPTGGQLEETSATLPMTSTPNDAVYRVTLVLPRYSETGTWWLSYASLEDGGGNIREYDPEGLEQLGVSASFEVWASDVTGPELVGVTLESSSVNVGSGDVSVKVTVQATDDLSGIAWGQLIFSSPSGKQHVEVNSGSGFSADKIDDGIYIQTVTLSRYSESGTWRLSDAWLSDNAGNARHYGSAELARLGLAVSFEVVRN